MQKIKIKFDYTEMVAISSSLNSISLFVGNTDNNVASDLEQGTNLDFSRDTHDNYLVKSILTTLQSKFLVKNKQDSYSKNLEYFEIYALSRMLQVLLNELSFDEEMASIISVLHSKTDKYIFKRNAVRT